MSIGSWTKSTSGYTTQGGWTAVASSSNGEKCIAANTTNTRIWRSSNYGVSWDASLNSPTSTGWSSVTISQSGNKVAACETLGAGSVFNIYICTNPFNVSPTWTNIATSGTGAPGNGTQWTSVCYSIDENALAACNGSAVVYIYNLNTSVWTQAPTTTQGGASVTPRCNIVSSNTYGFVGIGRSNWIYTIYGANSTYISGIIYSGNSNLTPIAWTCISSSLDGNTLVICAEGPEYIYVGTKTGTGYGTWNFVRQTAAGSAAWRVVAAGPDMVSIAACSGDGSGGVPPGAIWIGNKSYGSTSYAWTRQNMQNGSPLNGDWRSISRSLNPNQYTKFITLTGNTLAGEQTGIWVFTSTQTANQAQLPPPIVCFKEDSKILTDKGYVPIQDLRRGDLVETLNDGFVAIYNIGRKDIYNPALQERIKDQLYKCSQMEYPEVFEDLVITGCHSILVDDFINEEQRQKTIDVNGNTYVTDKKYRLPACADPRASIYENQGAHTIYHLALEHDDYYMNYGIYANGLLVETCSKRYLKELSDMTLIE